MFYWRKNACQPRVGGHRTRKATVNAALREYVQRRKHLGILKLFGKIDYDENYDYKRERRRNQQ